MSATHNEARSVASLKFAKALDLLEECAAVLRGPCIVASREAMGTEIAVTKAIEALTGSGFRVPTK